MQQPSQPQPQPNNNTATMNLTESCTLLTQHFLHGIQESIPNAAHIITILQTKEVHRPLLNVVSLNVAVLLPYIFGAYYTRYIDTRTSHVEETLTYIIIYATYILPLFLITIPVNANAYSTIANVIAKLKPDKSKGNSKATSQHQNPITQVQQHIATEAYRILLFTTYSILATAVEYLPFGTSFSFILFTWIYAFYALEYHWAHLGYSVEQRTQKAEMSWAYTAGYGTYCRLRFPTLSDIY